MVLYSIYYLNVMDKELHHSYNINSCETRKIIVMSPRADKSKRHASSCNLLDLFASKRKVLQSTDDEGKYNYLYS